MDRQRLGDFGSGLPPVNNLKDVRLPPLDEILGEALGDFMKEDTRESGSGRREISFADRNRFNKFYEEGKKKSIESKENIAIQFFNKCLQIDPNSPDALLERGINKFELGRFREALNDLNNAFKYSSETHNPYHYSQLEWRGNTKNKLGDYRGAIEDFSALLRDNPADYQGYGYRAENEYMVGDIKGAWRDCNLSIEGDPKHAYVAFSIRGKIKRKLGNLGSPREDEKYAKMLNLDRYFKKNGRNSDELFRWQEKAEDRFG